MTRFSESSVRRVLVKLKKSGLISYVKRKRDFRGPNRPTNTYALNPARIQELIDAGRKVVDKALGEYYETAGIPKHDRNRPVRLTGQSHELPVRMSGITTGQDVPQDISLSIENLHLEEDGDHEPPHEEFDVEGSSEPSWEDLREMETLQTNDTNSNINPCLRSSSKEREEPELDKELTIPTPSPISAPPPSPPLPAQEEDYAFSYCPSNGIVYKVTLVDGKPVGQTFDHYYGSKPGELGLTH
jgi:hypothetical protein